MKKVKAANVKAAMSPYRENKLMVVVTSVPAFLDIYNELNKYCHVITLSKAVDIKALAETDGEFSCELYAEICIYYQPKIIYARMIDIVAGINKAGKKGFFG
jgi:hypothetical protein